MSEGLDAPNPVAKDDPGAWTPPPDDGSGGGGDTGGGGAQDATPTTADKVWGAALPDLKITAPSTGAGSQPPPPAQGSGPRTIHFDVELVRLALKDMLTQLNALADEHNSVQGKVVDANANANFWGQRATKTEETQHRSGGSDGGVIQTSDHTTPDDAMRALGSGFAPSIKKMMDLTLNQVDQTLFAAGQFMAKIENSAENYASTDAALKPDVPDLVDPSDLTP